MRGGRDNHPHMRKIVRMDMINTLWVAVLVGVLIGAFAPEWIKFSAAVVAVVLSGLLVRVTAHHARFVVSPWLIAVSGVVFGLWSWHYARRRGLQHLGEFELRNRWTNARTISSWGW